METQHPDIVNRKKLSELLTFNEFEKLKNMLLLFNKNSKFYEYSGMVTASLLDYEPNQTTVLAINTAKGWFTFKLGRNELLEMLNCCDAFIGIDAEHSFLLENG